MIPVLIYGIVGLLLALCFDWLHLIPAAEKNGVFETWQSMAIFAFVGFVITLFIMIGWFPILGGWYLHERNN